MPYQCYSVRIDSTALKNYSHQINQPNPQQALLKLAEAIALDRYWLQVPHATLAVRSSPYPAIAVFGEFNSPTGQQILSQLEVLNHGCQRLCLAGYDRVTQACEKLSEKLILQFGAQEIQDFKFLGIPRGGLIVLGLLSYCLDLKPEQLTPPLAQQGPLVIVDDCALSGRRFSQTLSEYQDQPIIFTPLYSHPELRAAIAQENNVIQCLSGEDLGDYHRASCSHPSHQWQVNAPNLIQADQYWTGQPDYICFPWNEPDQLIWNSSHQLMEKAWRIVPQEQCLKNRPLRETNNIPVHTQYVNQGEVQSHEDVIWITQNTSVMIAHINGGDCLNLKGETAEIWRSLMKNSNLKDVVIAISHKFQISSKKSQFLVLKVIERLESHQLIAVSNHSLM